MILLLIFNFNFSESKSYLCIYLITLNSIYLMKENSYRIIRMFIKRKKKLLLKIISSI